MNIRKIRYNKTGSIELKTDLFMAFYCDSCFRKLRVSSDKYGYGLVCPHCGEGLICPKPSFHMGEELGNYRIDGWLAAGAMGEVYYAHGINTGKIVALKVLNSEETNELSLKIFENEGFLLKSLNHLRIPVFSSAGVHDGKYRYIAMEFYPAEEAEKLLIRLGQLSESVVLKVIIQIAELMEDIWAQFGLLHRDIKPANILIDGADNIMLIDWGLAVRFDDRLLTNGEQTLGTPHYICPKIVENIPNPDYRSDMYSLGATAFQLITGEFPHYDEDLETLIDLKLNTPVPDPRELNPGILPETAALIQKMMGREYEDRYENWDQVIYIARMALQKL